MKEIQKAMGEKRAITYKQVERAAKEQGQAAHDLWRKVGQITGAGAPGLNADGNASIDITEASESVHARVDRLLGTNQTEEVAADESKANKAGKKEK